jgi:murein DD-endopeptidase MepM/ murein hydrolase activator NlpD
VATAVLAGAAGTALAEDVELPTSPSAAPAAGAAPAPAAAAAAPAATVARPRMVRIVLRVGSTGPAVKSLQRALRRHHIRVAVDGEFGPATRRAVTLMQKRLRMRQTGVADTKLLRRLHLKTRTAASAPVRATAPAGSSRYLDVFPLAGTDYTYGDDFGAARHQGAHEGVDIMADRGTPIVAVASGTIIRMTRVETGLGGIYVWLQRDGGTQFYYAHMNAIAAGLAPGSAVTVGQVIGQVGNTGDARYGATHLHFEIHPGGGAAQDPYRDLVAVDPTRR